MDYKELENARKLFGLADRATLREIKSRYRKLVKLHHPDRDVQGDPELIRKLNAAHKILLDYCENYSYSFEEEEFYMQNPDERLRMQFSDDPLWGNR